MAGTVGWTETAWRDLEHIADYIAEDSPGYAAAFVGRVRDRVATLATLPLRGRVVPELGDPIVREMQVGNYRLIYEVREKTTYVLGLIHGARDLAALWAREHRSEPDRPS